MLQHSLHPKTELITEMINRVWETTMQAFMEI